MMGTLELEIMNAIWTMLEENEDRNISVTDVANLMKIKGCDRAYTTIKTVMDRLVSKGTLARFKNGKKFFYVATINRHESKMMSVKKISEQYFSGNYSEMIRFIEQEIESLIAL